MQLSPRKDRPSRLLSDGRLRCPPRLRCYQRTNIPCSTARPSVTARAFTNCPSGQGYPSESTLLVTRKAILQNWRKDNRVEDLTENGVFIPWRDLQADPHWDLCTTPMFHLRT
ncbi:hypothetical protein FOWG_05086 [Fusarium oxysporum f. sp. lycopersici MN25]|uniref:Uncharacterized protein n=1 Tax=Fusarium oxysporum Fo47 TaxID=660027 RepID=W9JWK8_FUSOX|nr:hypothetical protein FOZG_12700 [Fusarium oxysporum Fo47]EWZ95019.1 hypothetical protein FOWG_05086 [Fusarium oxysporum f. sp. lycopersici MN25]